MRWTFTILLIINVMFVGYGQNRSLDIGFIDPSCGDSPIKGVRVKVEGPEFLKTYRTNKVGRFIARELPEGEFRLIAEKYGFKRSIFINILLKGETVNFRQTYRMERGYASDDPNVGEPKFDPSKHQDKP